MGCAMQDIGAVVQLGEGVITAHVFGAVLDWIHIGRTEKIDAATAVSILMLADYLQMEPLKRWCGRWIADSLDPANVVCIMESAMAVHEDELVAKCLAVVEENTEAVLAEQAFLTTVTEETLCRILASPRLFMPEELTLYRMVISWGESVQERAGQAAATHISLAEVVAKPMSHVRLGLIPVLELSTVVMAAGVVPIQDVALAMAFQGAGLAAVPDADPAQFTPRTGTAPAGAAPVFVAIAGVPIAVTEEGRRLNSLNDSSGWGMVRSGTALARGGRHYAEFELTAATSIMLGVATAAAVPTGTPHSQTGVWFYYAPNGSTFSGGGNRTAQWVGQQGSAVEDKVGLLVDLSGAAGSITVYKNGAELGVMYTGADLLQAELHWAVCLHSHASVVVQPAATRATNPYEMMRRTAAANRG